MSSDQRAALVTGGGRGIGRAVCLELARIGFAVAVNYCQNEAAAREVQEHIVAAGGRAERCRADVASAADRDRLVAWFLETFGRIDLLVNNAGVAPERRVDLLAAGEESWDRVIDTNLKGPYFLTQRVAQEMIRLVDAAVVRAPKIVNISSLSAYAPSPERGEYCVSKAGMAMMTKLFAVRLAPHGILVYEIRPGLIATDMTQPAREKYDRLIADGLTPLGRWGQPEDVAQAVSALAQGLLPFSTGTVIDVDGGFHLHRL